MNEEEARTNCRRALEALRNGVPNHEAVGALGCNQPEVEKRFRSQLSEIDRRKQVAGILIAGGFGTGKSHLLEFLEREALEANCVCSRIVISKETPLYDLGKVYRAAVEQALVPGRTGQAIQEVSRTLDPKSRPYADFYHWAQKEGGLPEIFPATLLLHERLHNNPELVESVTGFWSGDKITPSLVRQGLKEAGAPNAYNVKAVPLRTLGVHRFSFASRLITAAGFKGWILLIDEVELIGRYSVLQRGRAYAELARWMGAGSESVFGGLAAVLAITDDYALAVLDEKDDRQTVPAKLRRLHGDYADLAERAVHGMRLIQSEAVSLVPPDEASLARTYKRLKEIHAAAYGWAPPDLVVPEHTISGRMRSYVRRWITEWDLRRLYPGVEVNLQEERLGTDYEEDVDLETFDEWRHI